MQQLLDKFEPPCERSCACSSRRVPAEVWQLQAAVQSQLDANTLTNGWGQPASQVQIKRWVVDFKRLHQLDDSGRGEGNAFQQQCCKAFARCGLQIYSALVACSSAAIPLRQQMQQLLDDFQLPSDGGH
jgi:hypothetical protein